LRSSSVVFAVLSLFHASCAAEAGSVEPVADPVVFTNARLAGGASTDLGVRGGVVVPVSSLADAPRVDLQGRFVVPAFIDTHVHVVYLPRGKELVAGGIAGVVDLAAPEARLDQPDGGPTTVFAGPILTAPGGYPTQSWGRDGYGLEVSDADEARAAVDRLHAAGVGVIKTVVGASGPQLDPTTLAAITARAHELGLQVGVHALDDASARIAGEADCDILVHAPQGELSTETVALWKDKAVISTISAFGGRQSTRQLREAGAQVLYGTDYGNTSRSGISDAEIRGMVDAGMDGHAIIRSGTVDPAERFGFSALGSLDAGKEASFVVLARDPHEDPFVLAAPEAVVWRGKVVGGELP